MHWPKVSLAMYTENLLTPPEMPLKFSVIIGGECNQKSFEFHTSMMKLQVNFPTTSIKRFVTPLKINMDHNHGGLEDHFPF